MRFKSQIQTWYVLSQRKVIHMLKVTDLTCRGHPSSHHRRASRADSSSAAHTRPPARPAYEQDLEELYRQISDLTEGAFFFEGARQFSSTDLTFDRYPVLLPPRPPSAPSIFTNPAATRVAYETKREQWKVDTAQWVEDKKLHDVVGVINPLLVKAVGIRDMAWQIELGEDALGIDEPAYSFMASRIKMLSCQPPLPKFPATDSVERTMASRVRCSRGMHYNNALHRVLVRVLKAIADQAQAKAVRDYTRHSMCQMMEGQS